MASVMEKCPLLAGLKCGAKKKKMLGSVVPPGPQNSRHALTAVPDLGRSNLFSIW